MKRLLALLTLACLVLVAGQTKASHVGGGDITYIPTGNPNEFIIRLLVYRDCVPNNATLGTTASVCYSSISCGQNGNLTLNETSVVAVPSSICVNASPGNCVQAGAPGDFEVHTYETVFTMPGACPDWTFSWELCCRNAAITTLVNASGQGMYVETQMNNVLAPADHSPVFNAPSYARFCVGNLFTYSQAATDADGDSLVFSLIQAKDATGNCPHVSDTLEYMPGFSATSPLSSAIPITINPNNGDITFLPTTVQVAVIVILCEEFRNGVKIGSIMRDIQVKIVANCNPVIPGFPGGIVGGNVNGTAIQGAHLKVNCNDRTIILPLDTTYPIQCNSAITSDFRTIAPYGIPNPIVNVQPVTCNNGLTDSLEITFLNPLSQGVTRLWSKRGFDGNTFLSECGFELPTGQDTVYLYVDTTIISKLAVFTDSVGCVFNQFSVNLSDSVYCSSINPDGSDFIMTDATGTNIPISSAYGYCPPNGLKCNELLINLSTVAGGTAPYYLIINGAKLDGNTLADDCGRYLVVGDTLAILYQDNFIPVTLGSDQSVCAGATAPVLDAGISAPGLTYQWSNQNGPIAGATNATLSVTQTGTYSVIVQNGPTCQGGDTINMTIVAQPQDPFGADITQCTSDPIALLNAGNAGATYQWYYNGAPINGATSQTYQPATGQGGNYSVRVDNGSNCIGNFDINVTLLTQYAATLSNETICANATATQLSVGPFGGNPSIQWSYNGQPISGATGTTYQPTNAGTYSVTVGSGTCAANASMTLTLNAIPVVALSNITICDYDQKPTLSAGSQSGSATYQWADANGAISGATANTYTPTSAGQYTVTVTVPPGCSASSTMTLTENASPSIYLNDQAICTDGSATLDPSVNGASYLWSTGATTQTITTTTEAMYYVTVTQNGCVARDSAFVDVQEYPAAPVIACGSGSSLSPAYTYLYSWAAIPGAVSYEISEDNGANWIASNAANGPETHGTNNAVPNFLVRAIGGGLCKVGYSSEPAACDVTAPNVINPNSDQADNKFFKITNIEQYANNKVQIFNRWGKEVFTASPYDNTTKRFDAKDVPAGTYFYIITLGQDGKEPKSGSLTVVK